MKTVNSVSGGQTSAYIAANYPADYDIFALVRTDDPKCKYPDKKLRKVVEDRIQKPFVGTLEDDTIIHTILDLEQFIGREITWISGPTFDETIAGQGRLPSSMRRYCTSEMKFRPILHWWYETINAPIEMRIGYRANETSRAERMMQKADECGFEIVKDTVRKRKDGRNHWEEITWRKAVFPLIEDNIYRDNIETYWKGKPVRFAPLNNCVGCFHRNEILLKKMSEEHPNKFEWFAAKERARVKADVWRPNGSKTITYDQIKKHKLQIELSFDDFTDCDTGYCGL